MPGQFVERGRGKPPVTLTPDGVQRCQGREHQVASVSRRLVNVNSGKGGRDVGLRMGRKALVTPLVCPK